MIMAQNNRFGTVAKIEGRRMEFATEDEALEYEREIRHGNIQNVRQQLEFSPLLQRNVG